MLNQLIASGRVDTRGNLAYQKSQKMVSKKRGAIKRRIWLVREETRRIGYRRC